MNRLKSLLLLALLFSYSIAFARPVVFYITAEALPPDPAGLVEGRPYLRINNHRVYFYKVDAWSAGGWNATKYRGIIDSGCLFSKNNSIYFGSCFKNGYTCQKGIYHHLFVERTDKNRNKSLHKITTTAYSPGQRETGIGTSLDLSIDEIDAAAAEEIKQRERLEKEKAAQLKKEKEKQEAIKKATEAEHDKLLETLERIFKKTIRPVCFTDGTKIKAANEHGQMVYRELQTIAVGDKVWTCNLTRKACELRPVRTAIMREVTKVLQIATDTETLEVTPEHPFYVTGSGWVEAKKLKVGDNLYSRLESVNKIASIEEVSGHFHVYNIEVEAKEYDNQNYFVTESDLSVHNCNVLAGAALIANATGFLAGGAVAGIVIVVGREIIIANTIKTDSLAEVASDIFFDSAMMVNLAELGVSATKHLVSKAGRVLEFGKQTKVGRDAILDSAKEMRHTVKNVTSTLTPNKIKNYLSNVESVPRETLIKDIQSMGLTDKGWNGYGKGFVEFVDKNKIVRAKIHPPDKMTSTNHLHIYDKNGNSLNNLLKKVTFDSKDAHLPIQ